MKTQPNQNPEGQIIKHGKLLYTEITIQASPETVWNILTDFNNYPQWNPFIKSLKGAPQPGQNIEVFLQPPGAKGMLFKPKVLRYDPNKEFRWIGRFIMPRLFDGEHGFRLIDNGNGTITFQQFERFRGILLPFLKKMLDKNTHEGFTGMNQALKIRAEQ
ncbi:MAG: SRPBCC domain-containing protein [Bacteroidetes bacterium]|nr:SRPBCC domain-containing protein [Bacteroidota bacterium]